jgi:hypothetical protein
VRRRFVGVVVAVVLVVPAALVALVGYLLLMLYLVCSSGKQV